MSDPVFIEEPEEELPTTLIELLTEDSINKFKVIIIYGDIITMRVMLSKLNSYYIPAQGQTINIHLDSGLHKIRFKNRKIAKIAESNLNEILENL